MYNLMNKAGFDKVKELFNDVKHTRESIIQLFTSLDLKINKLTEIHDKLNKENKTVSFSVGLDPFRFQKTLLRTEYNNLEIVFKMISNRVYFDYYKLSKLIKEYVINNIEDMNIRDAIRSYSQYPIYDTLNVHKEYDFDTIILLYNDIVNTLICIEDYCVNEDIKLSGFRKHQESGLNINSFVLSQENITLNLRNKVKLFKDLIEFFVTLHKNYFVRFLTKIRILHSQVQHDIRFDESNLNLRRSSKLIVEELSNELDNKSLINEVAKELYSDTSSFEPDEKTISPKNKDEQYKSALKGIQELEMEAEDCLNQVIEIPYNTEEIFGPLEREMGKSLIRSQQVISKLNNNSSLNDISDEHADISENSEDNNKSDNSDENIKLEIK